MIILMHLWFVIKMVMNTSVLGNSLNVLKTLKMLGEMLTVLKVLIMSIVKTLMMKTLVGVLDLGLVVILVIKLIFYLMI